MPSHTFYLSVWNSAISLLLLRLSIALSLFPPHPLLQGGVTCLSTLSANLFSTGTERSSGPWLKTNAPYSPKSEKPEEGWGWGQLLDVTRSHTLQGVQGVGLGAGPHQGTSNPTDSFPFTYERMAAQRCQVTQMESHSTWVAEPGRVLGSKPDQTVHHMGFSKPHMPTPDPQRFSHSLT